MKASVGLSFVLTLAVGLASCSRQNSGAGGAGRARGGGGAAPVTVAAARLATVPTEIRTFGTAEPSKTVSIRAQVSEVLKAIHFRPGQQVAKDSLLFTIESRPFEAAVRQAQANLARNTALADNARRDADREETLLGKGISSPTDYDKSRANAQALIAATQADNAVIDTARLQIEYCTICSPIDGRAGDILVDAGNLLKANDTTLVVINQTQPIDVFFSLPQNELPLVRKYMAQGTLSVRATIPQDDGRPEIGSLTFIDNAVDKDTGMIRLAAQFKNRDERLWPGLYVQVLLTLTVRSDAIVVPSKAVETGRDGKYVFVLKPDSTVRMQEVTAGRLMGDMTVIEKGVAVGEQVVTDGQLRLTDGAKVVLKPASSQPEGGASTRPADRGERPRRGGREGAGQ